jgi:hypothetical protein
MLTEAGGLALLAAISPTALLVSAVFLGSANPRRTVMLYLAGAIVVTAVMGALVFVVLRSTHLSRPHYHQTRYGLRLGLGLLLLLAGGWLLRRAERRMRQPAPEQHQGLISRMIARPGPKTAFLTGLVVYSPSLTFVAAIQVVATSRASVAASVAAIVVVVVITLAFVWLPLALYLVMPERTSRVLTGFNGWLRAHGQRLLAGALLLGGVVVTIDGILGLTGVA